MIDDLRSSGTFAHFVAYLDVYIERPQKILTTRLSIYTTTYHSHCLKSDLQVQTD